PVLKLRKKALLSKQAKLETELVHLQQELKNIDDCLGSPKLYVQKDSLALIELTEQRRELEKTVEELEESWLKLEMQIDE
ncbi:MAG: ABC transporter ATP-binding protein, partial [Pseudomonadota bacterium]|nr:ABC transporter ATP-binding protein [Pseudomonadota bacterium]